MFLQFLLPACSANDMPEATAITSSLLERRRTANNLALHAERFAGDCRDLPGRLYRGSLRWHLERKSGAANRLIARNSSACLAFLAVDDTQFPAIEIGAGDRTEPLHGRPAGLADGGSSTCVTLDRT